MRTFSTIALFLLFAFVLGVGPARSGEDPADSPLQPVVGDSGDDDFEPEEETADTPLEPAVDRSGKRSFRYGAILEYWHLDPGRKFSRMPSGPSLTGMVDDGGKQFFYAGAMLRDNELKNYANRQGLLRWTTYFRATKPGQHVFLLAPTMDDGAADAEYAGASLAVNDEVKIVTPANIDASAAVDFSAPGWYKLQIRLWWTGEERPRFEDYAVTLKVREPGSLSLRPLVKKDLYYRMP